jgi:hypothetical protein
VVGLVNNWFGGVRKSSKLAEQQIISFSRDLGFRVHPAHKDTRTTAAGLFARDGGQLACWDEQAVERALLGADPTLW